MAAHLGAAMLVTKGIRTMKTLPLALILTLALAGLPLTKTAQAETIVDGVIYPEITELGRPRTATAQPQLGSYRAPQLSGYARQPNTYVAQLPPPPVTGSKSTTIAPADIAPALTMTTTGSGPTVQSVPAYNQAAYGYGYSSVGTPQRVVYVQPATYSNQFPVQQVVNPQPVVMNPQPLVNVQPGSPYNPYAVTAPSVPWRPIVNLRSMPENYVVGQGIIGQPKVYVPHQPVRNFIRYITP
jgi:hypothetical protein